MKKQLTTLEKALILLFAVSYAFPILVWAIHINSINLIFVYAGTSTFFAVIADSFINKHQRKYLN